MEQAPVKEDVASYLFLHKYLLNAYLMSYQVWQVSRITKASNT